MKLQLVKISVRPHSLNCLQLRALWILPDWSASREREARNPDLPTSQNMLLILISRRQHMRSSSVLQIAIDLGPLEGASGEAWISHETFASQSWPPTLTLGVMHLPAHPFIPGWPCLNLWAAHKGGHLCGSCPNWKLGVWVQTADGNVQWSVVPTAAKNYSEDSFS